MAFEIDNSGNMSLIQGDSGNLTISGISTDRNYTIYFAFRDLKHNPVGGEISVESNQQDTVQIFITSELTDLLEVPIKDDFATYYYGLKACYEDEGIEDTLILGIGDMSEPNTVTVYPKRVEGTVNE